MYTERKKISKIENFLRHNWWVPFQLIFIMLYAAPMMFVLIDKISPGPFDSNLDYMDLYVEALESLFFSGDIMSTFILAVLLIGFSLGYYLTYRKHLLLRIFVPIILAIIPLIIPFGFVFFPFFYAFLFIGLFLKKIYFNFLITSRRLNILYTIITIVFSVFASFWIMFYLMSGMN